MNIAFSDPSGTPLHEAFAFLKSHALKVVFYPLVQSQIISHHATANVTIEARGSTFVKLKVYRYTNDPECQLQSFSKARLYKSL